MLFVISAHQGVQMYTEESNIVYADVELVPVNDDCGETAKVICKNNTCIDPGILQLMPTEVMLAILPLPSSANKRQYRVTVFGTTIDYLVKILEQHAIGDLDEVNLLIDELCTPVLESEY